MSTETMRFSSCFLAKKTPTVLFDLLGLGFPTFTAFIKIRREFTVSVDLSVSDLHYVATGAADNVGRVAANHSWPDVCVCGCVFVWVLSGGAQTQYLVVLFSLAPVLSAVF